MTLALPDDRLELFFGDATAAEGRIYARIAGADLPEGVKLAGQLIGPECRFARTLPATIPFQFRGRGGGGELLAEAIVPDPCFWTPELPMLYRARIVVSGQWLVASGGKSKAVERWIGIRRLGVRGRSLFLDGERWVLRGVGRRRAATADLAAARDADAALAVYAADDGFCFEASRQGVPLVVMVPGRGTEVIDEVRRLGQSPAVFLVVLDPEQPADFDPRPLARNLLLATHYRTDKPPGSLTWEHVSWCEMESAESPERYAECPLPIIAVRRLPKMHDIPAARSACDKLQSELASLGDFVGYIV